ncbi:MAG: hypothetical protein RLZZ65_692 [Bacteroidota bacterium]|jgi:cyclopropane fatty-acyl-phospholipid synthase-like methyltransferase
MNTKKNTPTGDPIGQAILDFAKNKKPFDIIVSSDLCDDDIIPIEVLFRTEKDMPELELEALSLCKGKVLDIGAGAGVHSLTLQDYGLDVQAIDLSAGAVTYMKSMGLNAKQLDFYTLNNKQKYNTILSLMNGFGLAKTLANLPAFLRHAFDLLEPGGCLIADSTDVKYLYEDEDGSMWLDLNSAYYGNFKFQMHYNKISGPVFDWLYVDYDTLHQHATEIGFKCRRASTADDHFLAVLQRP